MHVSIFFFRCNNILHNTAEITKRFATPIKCKVERSFRSTTFRQNERRRRKNFLRMFPVYPRHRSPRQIHQCRSWPGSLYRVPFSSLPIRLSFFDCWPPLSTYADLEWSVHARETETDGTGAFLYEIPKISTDFWRRWCPPCLAWLFKWAPCREILLSACPSRWMGCNYPGGCVRAFVLRGIWAWVMQAGSWARRRALNGGKHWVLSSRLILTSIRSE